MKNYTNLDKVIAGLRKEYHFGKFEDREAVRDPYLQFLKWFESALRKKVSAINAMALATASSQAKPSVRILLLKGFDRKGFVFYTNYKSGKGHDIQKNSKAEMLLFWPQLERQIRISGRLVKISRAQSLRYFQARPRTAQLGAWVSDQSQPILSRKQLDEKFSKIEKKFKGKLVPLPPFWGGYRLIPKTYEFWQGRANRLNDRIFYQKRGNGWKHVRLQP